MFLSNLMPILSALRRHRIAAGLLVLETALTLAIVCNALHLIHLRYLALSEPSGQPEAEQFRMAVQGLRDGLDADALTHEDLRRLRALPGVVDASVVNQTLFGGNSNNSGVFLSPGKEQAALANLYLVDTHWLNTQGLRLVAGRNFTADEVKLGSRFGTQEPQQAEAVLINRKLAELLFPGKPAVGQLIYVWGGKPSRVVGVVETLMHVNPKYSHSPQYAMAFPVVGNHALGEYLVRVKPGQLAAVMKQSRALIAQVEPARFVSRMDSIADLREGYYAEDRAMIWLLGGVCVALLLVTALGVVGLASFWVQQRTRMIGIRRALGATQTDIRHYFQFENLLLSGMGVLLGGLGAVGLSALLARHYQLPNLPWHWLPLGALLLLLLGQLAVLAPARRAARLPAAVAMRA